MLEQTITGIGQSIYKYSPCVNLKKIETFFMKLWTKTMIFLTAHIFVRWTAGTLIFQNGLRLFYNKPLLELDKAHRSTAPVSL